MYHVSAQGVDEHTINVHYYYLFGDTHMLRTLVGKGSAALAAAVGLPR